MKRVPVVDNRGVQLKSCPASRARILIKKGKAVPRRDEQGQFYIQLTYEQNNGTPHKPKRKRVLLAERRLQRHPSRRARRIARQQSLFDVVSCAPFQPASEDTVAKKLDQVIVVDVESTCWGTAPPDGQEHEIIEVGLCMLDVASGERLTRRSILVRPEHSEVSPFCTELTTLTPGQVAKGVSFAEACAILSEEYDASQRVWASYGDYDRRQFEKQCEARAIDYPFGPSHINVKNLLALVAGLKGEIGMSRALELVGLPLEGTHHRGVDDAWNTARLLAHLILKRRSELTA